MAYVLDASVAACWAFEDEGHPDAEAAFVRTPEEEVIVPWLWWFEVRNILVVNERRGRISERETAVFLRQLARLQVRVDAAPGEDDVLRLARMHGLSVYDSAYLELAQRERVALATLDQRLRSAALAEGVGLVGGG